MKKIIIFGIFFIVFFQKKSFAQCSFGGSQSGVTTSICYDKQYNNNNYGSVQFTNIDVGNYVAVKVISGLKYNIIASGNVGFIKSITLFNAINTTTNVGTAISTNINNDATILNWTATFTGDLLVRYTNNTDCFTTIGNPANIVVQYSGGSNDVDSQNTVGINYWVGHVYDIINDSAPPIDTNAFASYIGYFTQPNTISGSTIFFNNAYADNCLSINSGGTSQTIRNETFAIRYQMQATSDYYPEGCYFVNIKGDDGVRLYIDGTLVFNSWIEQSSTDYNNVLVYLNGNSKLVFDYYDRTGGNVSNFSIYPATSTVNSLNVVSPVNPITRCHSTTTLLTGGVVATQGNNTIAPVQYQWQYSINNSTWVDISGATGQNYIVPATTPSVTTQIYYRRSVRGSTVNSAGCIYNSNAVTITTYAVYQASITSINSTCNTITPYSVNLKVNITGENGPFTVMYKNEITNSITTVTNYITDSNITLSPLPNQTTPYTLISVTDSNGCSATLINAYTSILFYSIPATPTANSVDVVCSNDTTGSITITNAYSPASLKFNGLNTNSGSTSPIDSYVDFGRTLLSNRAQFTAEGWIKINKNDLTGKNRMSLFGQNDVLEFGFDNGNLVCWTANGGFVTMSLVNYPSDNAWHHIAVVGTAIIGNSSNLKFYIDGVLVATSGTNTSNSNYGSSSFTAKIGWGVMDTGGVGLVGEVFNLGFWSRALSVDELRGLSSGFTQYNNKQVGLLAGYSFNEGTGTTVAPVGNFTPIATGTLKGVNLPVWTDPSVYSWTSTVPGFVTTSSKNLFGLKTGTYNLNISLKGCPKTTSFTINANNPEITTPMLGTITQPTCILATASVTLTGLPASGSWTISTIPATVGLTGLTGSNVDHTTVVGLTANTNYTFVVNNGTCFSIPSSTATINPIPTIATWNGNMWLGTTPIGSNPLLTQPIEFTGNYNSSGDINGCSCKVTSGNIVVNSGDTITITNGLNVTNNSTTNLVFENNASLVQTNNVTNTGAIEYRRISSPMKNFDFTYWASPVIGQTAKNLSPNTFPDKYFRYNGDILVNDWVFDNGVMTPGVGFIIRVPKPGSPAPDNWSGSTYTQPVAFKGVPNNGNYSFAVGPNQYNVVGNPYPSAIRADDFINANSTIIYGALYFWTHNTAISNNEYTANDYASYTLAGGIGTSKAPTTNLSGNVPNGFIAAGQSFFVENTASGSFQFTNAMRVTGNNSEFFKQADTTKKTAIEKNRVWLNLTNSGGVFKQLLVGYIAGATNDWDNLYDGISFDGQEFVDFYSINKGQNLTIQARVLPFVDTDVVTLGYRSTIAGPFDISIDNRDGSLENQKIWLEDKKTNTLHELTKSKYTFTAINGIENNRFLLKYTNKTLSLDDNEVAVKSLIICVKNKKITLTSSEEMITQVQIFDLLGRKIYDKSKIDSQEWSIPILSTLEQIVIVKTTFSNGTISNKKILY